MQGLRTHCHRWWPLRAAGLLVLCLAVFAVDAAASSAPWPAAASALRQRIEAQGERQRELSTELAQQALAGALPPEAQAWFLEHLTKDLFRLRRWAMSLAAARQGLALPNNTPPQQVYFATWAGYALQGQGQPAQAMRVYDEQIASLLPTLMASADPQWRLRGVDAMRMRGAALQTLPGLAGQAMEQLTQVLRLYDELPNSEGRAETLNMIAALRFAGGDVAQALLAQRQAIDAAEQGRVPGVLARLHALMAYLEAKAGNDDAHQRELQASLTSAVAEGDEYYQAMVSFNRSDAALRRKQWSLAIELTEQARRIFNKIGDPNMAAMCLTNNGIALNRSGQPGGIELIRQAATMLDNSPGQEPTVVAVFHGLAEELAFARQFESAYAAQLAYQRRSDALRQAANQERIAQAEAAYQADRQQRQIAELEHDRAQQQRYRWLWALAGLLGITVAAVVTVSRHYLKSAYRAMQAMALADPLTGLHNRRYLVSRIGDDLARLGRQRGGGELQRRHSAPQPETHAAFLLIDLDLFKAVNDEYGHAAGDSVLKQAATILKTAVRGADLVVRWGGEEFLIFVRLGAEHELLELAQRICAQMADRAFEVAPGKVVRQTCSIGAAAYPVTPSGQEPASWEAVVSLADQCLYVAKRSGRNMAVSVALTRDDAVLPDLPDLRWGLQHGHFRLAHSPGREVQWAPPEAPPHAATGPGGGGEQLLGAQPG